jgi:hypothetical protein
LCGRHFSVSGRGGGWQCSGEMANSEPVLLWSGTISDARRERGCRAGKVWRGSPSFWPILCEEFQCSSKEAFAEVGMELFRLAFFWDGYHEKGADGGKTVYTCEFLRSRSESHASFSLTRIRAALYFALRKNTSNIVVTKKG